MFLIQNILNSCRSALDWPVPLLMHPGHPAVLPDLSPGANWDLLQNWDTDLPQTDSDWLSPLQTAVNCIYQKIFSSRHATPFLWGAKRSDKVSCQHICERVPRLTSQTKRWSSIFEQSQGQKPTPSCWIDSVSSAAVWEGTCCICLGSDRSSVVGLGVLEGRREAGACSSMARQEPTFHVQFRSNSSAAEHLWDELSLRRHRDKKPSTKQNLIFPESPVTHCW